MNDHPEAHQADEGATTPPVHASPATSLPIETATDVHVEPAAPQEPTSGPDKVSTGETLPEVEETMTDRQVVSVPDTVVEPDHRPAEAEFDVQSAASDHPIEVSKPGHDETERRPDHDVEPSSPHDEAPRANLLHADLPSAQSDVGHTLLDDMADEPTTILPSRPDEMADEPTTIVPALHDDMQDEPTTIVHAMHDHVADEPATILMGDDYAADEPTKILHVEAGNEPELAAPDEMEERTTVLHNPADDMADEDTQILATSAPHAGPTEHVPDLVHDPIAPDSGVGDITEIRLALREANADAPDWFVTRLQDFVAALRENASGTRRSPEDFQALTMTARDMLARIAMQRDANATAEGFGSDSVLQPNQLLANTYIVHSLIARGGVGEIYRTRHRDLKTEHAVKVLLPRFALDPTMLTLMQDEARLLQCVRHEAVVGCQDLLRDADGRPMIVMDYLRGRTLSARLREGRLSPEELIVLARRLADGLGAIHAAGIVHQDISPDNVILAEDSCSAATIIDFGLARRLGTGRDMHRNLDFAGKFSWSSPEQLSGRPATVDARSDLYSLGLMLAAAARGFRLDMGNDLESARATRTTIPSLAGIEQPVAGLIEALLAPSPGARMASASEVGAMLEPRRKGFWEFVSRLWQRK